MLRAMEQEGLIIIRREKKADGKMKRKWDYMNVCYTTLSIAIIQTETPPDQTTFITHSSPLLSFA